MYNDKTSTELAMQYNVSRGMITKVWYDAGLKGKESLSQNVTANDLTGKKVNALQVLQKTDDRDASGCVMWLCQCDCGNICKISSTRLKSGIVKSCGCLSKKALEKGRGLNFNDLTNRRFGKLTVLCRCENKQGGDREIVQWECQCDCGKLTKVTSSNLITGNTQSCGFCNEKSHGNIKIAQLLQDNNITFEREKRFNDCKDKTMLPFDFYVNNKYLIEFDGTQHFKNSQSSLFDYESTHKHDLIKSQWCKDNHIPLIRIPYTAYDNLTIKDLTLESIYLEK